MLTVAAKPYDFRFEPARLALESALAARAASAKRSPVKKRTVKAGAGKPARKKPQG